MNREETKKSDPRQELDGVIGQTRRLLKTSQDFGITMVPSSREKTAAQNETALDSSGKAAALEPLRQKALSCQACKLAQGRNSVVWGEGSLDAEIVFVGEGPGRDEDMQGRPFVGRAGELLNRMIKAMGFEREQVYICNIVKCRPPMNRVPEPDEVAACHPYLEAQLTTIRPKVICALGKTAITNLLGIDAPMGKLRGTVFDWKGISLVATFHPAYLLRNPAAKTETWEDLKQVLKILGRPIRQAQDKPDASG